MMIMMMIEVAQVRCGGVELMMIMMMMMMMMMESAKFLLCVCLCERLLAAIPDVGLT